MATEKRLQKVRRSVVLYAPIEDRLTGIQTENFNWYVNLLFAEKLGVPEAHLQGYKRERGD